MTPDSPERFIQSTPESRARNEQILTETAHRLSKFECTGCGSRYVTPLAAALCCDVEYDQPAIVRSYD